MEEVGPSRPHAALGLEQRIWKRFRQLRKTLVREVRREADRRHWSHRLFLYRGIQGAPLDYSRAGPPRGATWQRTRAKSARDRTTSKCRTSNISDRQAPKRGRQPRQLSRDFLRGA